MDAGSWMHVALVTVGAAVLAGVLTQTAHRLAARWVGGVARLPEKVFLLVGCGGAISAASVIIAFRAFSAKAWQLLCVLGGVSLAWTLLVARSALVMPHASVAGVSAEDTPCQVAGGHIGTGEPTPDSPENQAARDEAVETAWVRGLEAYSRSDFAAAVTWFESAVALLPPDSVSALMNLQMALALLEAGSTHPALDCVNRAAALPPDLQDVSRKEIDRVRIRVLERLAPRD